jgi:hypothetical protein
LGYIGGRGGGQAVDRRNVKVFERSALSPVMALRVEKAFGVSMDTLMRMQNSYDIAKARKREGEIDVRRFTGRAAWRRSRGPALIASTAALRGQSLRSRSPS